jgi:hypothetical protein
MRHLAVAAIIFWLWPAVCGAQAIANADTVQAYGLTLIGGIDKFEYGPHEYVQLTLQIINSTSEPITVPNVTEFCPLVFVDDTWCQPDSSGCADYSENECLGSEVVPVAPGVTTVLPTTVGGSWPAAGNWIHTLGRVRFWDPWGLPWDGGPAFEMEVRFRRTPIVGVQPVGWTQFKQLYR